MRKNKDGKAYIHLRYLFNIAIECSGTEIEKKSIKTIKLLTKKHQIRLSQNIKRNICFECNRILIPTVSCTSKIMQEENGTFFVILCNCKQMKKYCFRGQKGLKAKNQ